MAQVQSNSIYAAVIALLLTSTLSMPSAAFEGQRGQPADGMTFDHDGRSYKWKRSGDRYILLDERDQPSHIEGLGTFAGSIRAVQDRNNGIYFRIDRADKTPQKHASPGPKLVIIGPHGKEQCAYEAGVCVIRP